ncbi:MAG: hypothetical protein KHZ58_07140 [Hungatella hathewayi]|nr:hypothetical protein [Hungatella hathewayi]
MRESRVDRRMQQVQTRAVERESAEEEYFLTVQIWAYGEEPYDCHPCLDGELLKGNKL